MTISTKSSVDAAVRKLVLDQHETTVTLDDVDPKDWVKVRAAAKGALLRFYQGLLIIHSWVNRHFEIINHFCYYPKINHVVLVLFNVIVL